MNRQAFDNYLRRFERVFEHIDSHLDEPLDLERLSGIAGFSRFHFHRQFSRLCGVTVGRYVQLMRLKRAAKRLVDNPDEQVIDIAFDTGFESPESFSRAFRQIFGASPSGFRRRPDWASFQQAYRFPEKQRMREMDVRIVDTEPEMVAVLKHRGSPDSIGDSVAKFIEWRKTSGLSPVKSSRSLGIVYDDPDLVAPEDFRHDLCGTITAPVPENDYGIETGTIPGGRCAVIRHEGSRDRVGDTIYWLFREWLPGSGEEPGDYPLYFHYLDAGLEVEPHRQQTDIYLPLKQA